MTLKSALEDLSETTLKAVSGVFGKLEYIAGLRRGAGYQHWGLSRVHGEDQAQQALTETHRSLLSRMLRTPLSRLLGELETTSRQRGMEPDKYLEKLQEDRAKLLPPNPGAGSEGHLNSALTALSRLVKKGRRGANPPTS